MSIVATLNISGTVTDTDGNSVPISAVANQTASDVITVNSVTVTPVSAVAGTSRTLTVNATSSLGQTLTVVVQAPGITFTPLTGQPAGQFAFSFVY